MLKFVHTNISPETILLSRNRDGILRSSFLWGFQSFRSANGMKILYSDEDWNFLLSVVTLDGKARRRKRLIEAVGTVLLEIELWNSFVISRSGVEARNRGPFWTY